MDKEQIKKIIDSPLEYDEEYDKLEEESYLSWAKSCIKNSQRWPVILIFVHFFSFLALAVVCGVLFLETDQTKLQIMYAALFVCCILIGYLIKVFGWVMVCKNGTSREIKRLELRIAELNETVKNK